MDGYISESEIEIDIETEGVTQNQKEGDVTDISRGVEGGLGGLTFLLSVTKFFSSCKKFKKAPANSTEKKIATANIVKALVGGVKGSLRIAKACISKSGKMVNKAVSGASDKAALLGTIATSFGIAGQAISLCLNIKKTYSATRKCLKARNNLKLIKNNGAKLEAKISSMKSKAEKLKPGSKKQKLAEKKLAELNKVKESFDRNPEKLKKDLEKQRSSEAKKAGSALVDCLINASFISVMATTLALTGGASGLIEAGIATTATSFTKAIFNARGSIQSGIAYIGKKIRHTPKEQISQKCAQLT